MDREYANFGLVLRQAREGRKRYQIQVARNVGVSGSFLGRVEHGVALPSLLLLATLWRLLGFDGNEVFEALGVRARKVPAELRQSKVPGVRARGTRGRFAAFGSLVAFERVLVEMTQEALAHALGIGVGFLYRIERGAQLPSVLVAAKLRDVLNLDGNDLLAAVIDDSPRETFHAFGRLLEVARERKELRPRDVANAAQCSTQVYKEWELGRVLPTLLGLARMHDVLEFNGNVALRAVWLADSQDREVG